jgi:hypothetical protein
MEVGTTLSLEVGDRRNGYLKANRDGSRFSIAGDGSIGDECNVRVVKKKNGTFIGVTEGATLRLRVDKIIDESTVKANPSYGPVFIQNSLSQGSWWHCVVTEIHQEYVTAEAKKRIPKNSDIKQGAPPEDPRQSLNELLTGNNI